MNYLKTFLPFEANGKAPKHNYTIEIHRCKFTEELCELGIKYETIIQNNKKGDRDYIQRVLCDNPLYDPSSQEDADLPCYPEMLGIDTHRSFKDEGIYPGLGGFHMYHRIDGKLVAVGVIDI